MNISYAIGIEKVELQTQHTKENRLACDIND